MCPRFTCILCACAYVHAGGMPGHTGTPGKSSSMLVKVVVPATVCAVVLVAVLVVLVVVGLLYVTKKRSRAFTFQRMTFSSINNNDGEGDGEGEGEEEGEEEEDEED